MKLFEAVRIGPLTIPNRVAKSAMVEGRADSTGAAAESLTSPYERWSRGGVGLMITGMAEVLEGWSLTETQLGLFTDANVEPLRRVTRAAHQGDGKIFVQLCHAPPQILRAKAKRLGSIAPSAGFNKTNLLFDRAIRPSEIREVVGAFGAAARRAREAGADGVQVHAAHGYLLSRFISPKHNRRRDEWGGTFEDRIAVLKSVKDSISAHAGRDFPVMIKLNAHDGEPGGLELSEAVRIARRVEEWGYAAIEVSAATADVGMGFFPNKGGVPLDLGQRFLAQSLPVLRPALPVIQPVLRHLSAGVAMEHEAYFLPEARAIAEAVDIPVLAVGGIRTLTTAERIVTETPVAMVSLARPLVRQPDLPRRWRDGRAIAASCESCNRCFVRVGLGEPLRCDLNPTELG